MDEYATWSGALTFSEIVSMFAMRGCETVLVKPLAARQDNDKNQIYVGPDLSDVGMIPSAMPIASRTSSRKAGALGRTKFQAAVNLTWMTSSGDSLAPNAKLIYYPQYPEVRLSGFLLQSPNPPRDLLARERRGQEPGRLLLLGVNNDQSRVWGLVLPPEGGANARVLAASRGSYGVFRLWALESDEDEDPRRELLRELRSIARHGWLPAVRFTEDGEFVPCRGTNCGGYTLEAHLGISPNGRSEPDFKGWEIKQHGVTSLNRSGSGAITLMTPEPSGGEYRMLGVEPFVRKHGYESLDGTRWDFGGVHRVGMGPLPRTGTSLRLRGFRSGRDFDPDGAVDLIGRNGELAASWSFEKLIGHWRRKHAATCYVPSIARQTDDGLREYRYGGEVTLGTGATFAHLLEAFQSGTVYYDPGINLKPKPSGGWVSKRRSQFRVNFKNVNALYGRLESVRID